MVNDTRPQYALFNTQTKQYWNGQLPSYKLRSGLKGKLAQSVTRYTPKFSDSPTFWRPTTASKKLNEYNLLRVVLPDLPSVSMHKIEMRLIITEEWDNNSIDERMKQYAHLFYFYGSTIASDWLAGSIYDRPDITYMARCVSSSHRGCITAPMARDKLPSSIVQRQTLFMNEDDVVIMRLLAPKTNIISLRNVLSGLYETELD